MPTTTRAATKAARATSKTKTIRSTEKALQQEYFTSNEYEFLTQFDTLKRESYWYPLQPYSGRTIQSLTKEQLAELESYNALPEEEQGDRDEIVREKLLANEIQERILKRFNEPDGNEFFDSLLRKLDLDKPKKVSQINRLLGYSEWCITDTVAAITKFFKGIKDKDEKNCVNKQGVLTSHLLTLIIL
jgi:hypothetical protein